MKDGLEREIKQIEREISELKKARSLAATLEQAVEIKKQITALEKKKHEKIKTLYAEYEKIDIQNDELQKIVGKQLSGKNKVELLYKIKWKLV